MFKLPGLATMNRSTPKRNDKLFGQNDFLLHKISFFKADTLHGLFQISHAFTLSMVLALSLSAIKLIDAEPPSFLPGNGKVTFKAIERQILAQTPVDVSESSLNTENLRSLVVCVILVTIPTCKKCKRCGGLSVRKAHYSFNHHCFPNNGNKNLNCGFSATCC